MKRHRKEKALKVFLLSPQMLLLSFPFLPVREKRSKQRDTKPIKIN
jgi:hypothetical protein